MIKFLPLNITDEDSIEYVLSHVDNSIQYGEDLEPKVKQNNIYFLHISSIVCICRNLKIHQNMNDRIACFLLL